jgi:pimeloyl-ACP methyl ester carboxylesterase
VNADGPASTDGRAAKVPAPRLTVEGHYLEVAGAIAFVACAGEGDAAPVLCVHTAGQTGEQWREVLADLPAAGYRVVAPDLPGHGRSDPAPGGPVADLGAYAEWCGQLLDALGVERAHLVGCSIGGRIVLDLAGRRPGLPLAVVAMAANRREGMVSLAGLRRELEDSTSPSRADRTYHGTLASLGTAVGPDRAELLAVRHRREDPIVTTSDLIGWAGHPLGELPAAIVAPVRLVCGAEDFWLDPAVAASLEEQIPNCTVCVLEGVGHYPMEEVGDFAAVLAGWLAAAGAGR